MTRVVLWNDRDRALADLGLTPDSGTRLLLREARCPQRLAVIEKRADTRALSVRAAISRSAPEERPAARNASP